MKRFFLALSIASICSGAFADNYIRLPVRGMHGAAPSHPATANLGIGKPPGTGNTASIALGASALNFGEMNVGQVSGAQMLRVTNSGKAESTLSVSASGAFAISGGTCAGTLAAGAQCDVGVVFQPTAPGRAVSGSLTVSSSDGTKVATLSGAAKLAAYPQLSMTATPNPASVYIIGSVYSYTVTVTNTGTMAATLGTSAITGQVAGENTLATSARGVVPCGAQLASGASCKLLPRFKPSVELQGRAPAVVTLPSNATNAYGEPMPQSITIDESSLSRNGALIANFKASLSVAAADAATGWALSSAISNVGNADTLVTGVRQVSGSPARMDTDCVGATLTAAGGGHVSCFFEAFAPTTPGTYTFVWAVDSDSIQPTTIEVTWTVTP